MKSTSQINKTLVRILPALVALLLGACMCTWDGISFSGPDVMGTSVAGTLTAEHSIKLTVEAGQGGTSPTPTITSTTTNTPTPTLTPTVTNTTQGGQVVKPTTSTPTKTRTPTRTTQAAQQKPAVEISSFTVDKATVTRPNPAVLKWQTKNADKVTLKYDSGGPANVDKTSNGFNVDTTTLGIGKHTLTLSATGGGKTVTKAVDIEILAAAPAAPKPSITFFNTDKNQLCISSNDLATLSWETKNANSVVLSIPGNQWDVSHTPSTGGWTIGASDLGTGQHTLKMTATNPQDSAQASVQIKVIGDANVPSFTTDKTFLSPGDIATLQWTTEHATSVKIILEINSVVTNTVWDVSHSLSSSGWTIGYDNLGASAQNTLLMEARNNCGDVAYNTVWIDTGP